MARLGHRRGPFSGDRALNGPLRRGIGGGKRRACEAVENGKELGAFQDTAVFIAVVFGGITNHFSFSIDGAIGGFHGYLGTAIAIEAVSSTAATASSRLRPRRGGRA